MCFIFNCQTGHFGSKEGSRLWSDWDVQEGESLIGESLAESSARESLGEPPISRVEASGSQQYFCNLTKNIEDEGPSKL